MTTVGIVGCGVIGEQVLKNIRRDRPDWGVRISRRNESAGRKLASKYGATYFRDNADSVKGAGAVFLCLRPQYLSEVLVELMPHIKREQALISVAAGISIGYINRFFPDSPIARYMPSTLMMEARGVALFAADSNFPSEFEQLVSGWSPKMEKIPDGEMHFSTAVTSCGGTFLTVVLREVVQKITSDVPEQERLLKLMIGVGIETLAALDGKNMGEINAIVDSAVTPGTMTIKGLDVLGERKVAAAFVEAVMAAAERSKEMQQQYEH